MSYQGSRRNSTVALRCPIVLMFDAADARAICAVSAILTEALGGGMIDAAPQCRYV